MATENTGDGCSLGHRIAESGCFRAWNFLLSCLDVLEKPTMLRSRATNENTNLIFACFNQTSKGHVKIIQSILSDEYIKYADVNQGGDGARGALYR